MAITKIAQVTLASTAGGIVFSAIPSTFTDLYVVFSGADTTVAGPSDLWFVINGDYSGETLKTLSGSGSAVTSSSNTNFFGTKLLPGSSATANTFCNVAFYLPNYASTSAHTISIDGVGENNGSTAYQFLGAGAKTVTTPISSVGIYTTQNLLAINSSATLYGISKSGATGATVS